MTLIEGIGDEVTHFFIALFVVVVVTLAWWTTSISEQRHVRTVLLLDRRRHRTHRRLTNHTETVTITEGTTILTPVSEENPNTEDATAIEPLPSTRKPPEATSSTADGASASTDEVGSQEEEQNIIETMDADACVLRQRRLAFYDNWSGGTQEESSEESQTTIQPTELPQSSTNLEDRIENVCMEPVVVETLMEESESLSTSSTDGTAQEPVQNEDNSNSNKSGITIKLKYINDDLKLVDGRLEELLGDFKKRHFQPELEADKLVRLIFNGQVLQPDTQTLKKCGLFDNCVVHCLIHQKRVRPVESNILETRRDGYSFPSTNGLPNLNNNNQNRDWDLGNFLFAFISFILLAAWYFRYVYAHLYTVTATVGLILITGIFTIVLVGMYFPDNEHLPNPTIRIARERVQPQQ